MSENTTIGADATISGRISGQDLQVMGAFDGEITLKGTLRVGPQGRVKAVVKAAVVEIRGSFDGEVGAGTLIFGDSARASGIFRSDRIQMHEGAIVNGAINGPERARPVADAASPSPS